MRLSSSLTNWLRRNPPNPATSMNVIEAKKTVLPERTGTSLRLRLLLIVIVALIPAAIVSIVQGVDRVQLDVSAAHERLLQLARATASDSEMALATAEQILRAVALQPEVRQATPECGNAFANTLRGFSYFTNIARIDAQGMVLCALVMPQDRDASNRPWWPKAKSASEFFVTPQVYSETAQRNVLGGVLSLKKDDGEFDGVVAIGWDASWVDFMLRTKAIPERAAVALFDSDDSIVAANDRAAAIAIFRGVKKPGDTDSGLMSTSDENGNRWSYALVPLRGKDIYVAFAMADNELFSGTYYHVAADLLLPVLTLGLASLAMWFATDRLVLRWIEYLRRIATAYGRGHYAIRPVIIGEAPSECRILGETFSTMAAAVQDRDRRLREALAQKSLLIRETHHRVKNNMQIVMSLLSLQERQVQDPAAQNALRQAQVRVNALALVHRILHEIENLETVDLKRLLEDLTEQIREGFGARRDLRIELNIEPRQVSSDLAVPLTLFTVEVLTNAFKHAFRARTSGVIRLSLLPIDGGKLRLSIEDDGAGMDQGVEATGVGSRLIKAFTQQIGGSVAIGPRKGGGTSVTLTFRDPLFVEEFADAGG